MSRESIPDLSRLYREHAREEPPEWLDARIEAAAQYTQRGVGGGGRRRWYVPVALAATVILSTSIALLNHLDRYPADPETKPLADGASSTHADKPSAAAPSQQVEQRDRSMSARVSRERRSESAIAGGESRQTADPASVARAMEESSPPAPPVGEAPSAPPPAPASKPALAASSATAGERESPDARAESIAPERADSRSRIESLKRREVLAYQAKQEQVAGEAPRNSSFEQDPEAWLQYIGRLVRDGRGEEARESLTAFRKRFPNHPVPDELK